jgi:uncharacterized protein (DUF362 family)
MEKIQVFVQLIFIGLHLEVLRMGKNRAGEVFIIKTDDRTEGINMILEKLDMDDFNGKNVALKANFNSADPFPASTHIQTFQTILKKLKGAKSGRIILAERSGMENTREVLEKLGIFDLASKFGFEIVVLDEEGVDGWFKTEKDGNHWFNGFYISKIFLDADKVVQTCCLKTHRFGGHFTLSLKNSVGLVAKRVPGDHHDYMSELHTSPFQRLMIAEINKYYPVDLVLIDAMKAFINKGPETGLVVEPNLIIAGKDRIAVDAVGVAILRYYGTTMEVSKGRIFELDQIRRAAELGVGIQSADEIALTPVNEDSQLIAEDIETIIEKQG